MAGHLAGEGAGGVDLLHRIFVGIEPEAKELVVGGEDARSGCAKGTPVVVIIAVEAGSLEGDIFARNVVEPRDDAVQLSRVEGGVVHEDGGGNSGGPQCPLDLIPRLRPRVVVKQSTGLCPGVDLRQSTGRLGVIARSDVLIHSVGDPAFEGCIRARGCALRRVDGTAGAGEVVMRDVHGGWRCGDVGRGNAGVQALDRGEEQRARSGLEYGLACGNV